MSKASFPPRELINEQTTAEDERGGTDSMLGSLDAVVQPACVPFRSGVFGLSRSRERERGGERERERGGERERERER